MKKLIIFTIFLLSTVVTLAQWSAGPGDLYNLTPGKIGINTSTPAWTLDVTNPSNFSAIIAQSPYTGTTNRAIGIFRMVNSATNDFYNISLRVNGGNIQCVQNANVAGFGAVDISLFTFATRKWECRAGVADVQYSNSGNFLLNSTGYVGIGTTVAPPADVKLAVNGKVNCKEIEVTLTGWSDFVFNNNYKLRSLYDVENFINEYKHLPDVPSTTEVISKGSNLGEMDAILLQKIEELTLYMIDLKKENDALKTRINSLEK